MLAGSKLDSNITISLTNSTTLKLALAFVADRSMCADVLLHGLEESHCTAEQRLEGLQLFVRLLNYASSDEARYQVLLCWCSCTHGCSYLNSLPFHSVAMEATLREQWAAFLVQVVALLSRAAPRVETSLLVAALQCWHIPFTSEHDLAFLHEVDIFTVMASLIVKANDEPSDGQYEATSQRVKLHALEPVTHKFSLQVDENAGMVKGLLEADNSTFWESGNDEFATIFVIFNESTRFREVSLFISNASDMRHAIKRVTISVGTSPEVCAKHSEQNPAAIAQCFCAMQWCEEVTSAAPKQRDGWFSVALPQQFSCKCIKVNSPKISWFAHAICCRLQCIPLNHDNPSGSEGSRYLMTVRRVRAMACQLSFLRHQNELLCRAH